MTDTHKKQQVGMAYQIPRNALALLMISQVAVILPLAVYITAWIIGVGLFCGYWRSQVYRGRWGYPAGWVKAVLVFAGVTGIALSGYGTFSLEAATSLLVLAFALKLLEMKTRRDAYLIIFLSYFLIATAFLFDQAITMAAYQVIAAVVITAAMVSMNQLQSRVRPLASLKLATGLILQALPLTLVLFLLFPRIAPLWSIPMPSSAATGISDSIKPGDVANLTLSDELAFRAVFEDVIPAPRDLYWRGLTYSEFDQGTWRVGRPLTPRLEPPAAVGAGIGYEVFLEPTQAEWLFSLDTPVEYGARLKMLGDYRLINPEPILSVKRYRLVSDPEFVESESLYPLLARRETALPEQGNERMRDYAITLYEQSDRSAERMIETMMAQIRNRDYVYTLQPPLLGSANSIDEFWFDSRRGFCSHYAGAMVFALRAAGVPARMVGGYQGGEINPVTGHVEVRQYLAHAWVEVWLDGSGWKRVDPTAAVAPARVENGFNAALSGADRAALSFLTSARLGESDLLSSTLQWFGSIEHRWNFWVVGYDATTQSGVLQDLLGKVTPARIGIALMIGGGLSMCLVAIAMFWRRRPTQRNPVERKFHGFCSAMARQGYGRAPDETPAAYIRRLAIKAELDPQPMMQRLQAFMYDPDVATSDAQRRQLHQDFRKLRFKLAFSTPDKAS